MNALIEPKFKGTRLEMNHYKWCGTKIKPGPSAEDYFIQINCELKILREENLCANKLGGSVK